MQQIPNSALISDLEVLLYAKLIRAIRIGQKATKRLELTDTRVILVIGHKPEGMNCVSYARFWQVSRQTAHTVLGRAVKAGWVVREGMIYKLSERGIGAYEALRRAISKGSAELREMLIRDASREMKRNSLAA